METHGKGMSLLSQNLPPIIKNTDKTSKEVHKELHWIDAAKHTISLGESKIEEDSTEDSAESIWEY